MQDKKLKDVNFSDRFRELLETSGKTQKEIATALGLSEGALINYKRDSVPKSNELLVIARYFGVTMEWLLTGTGAVNIGAGDSSWRQRALQAEQKLTDLKSSMLQLVKKF